MDTTSPDNGQPTPNNDVSMQDIAQTLGQHIVANATADAVQSNESISIAAASCIALAATSEFVEILDTVFEYRATFDDINPIMDNLLNLVDE